MEPSTLITRLDSLRTRIRRRLLAYGACTVATGGVLAFLGMVTIDWMFHLPAALRALGVALFVLGFALSLRHWIIKPLRARLGLREIAGKLEQHFHRVPHPTRPPVSFFRDQLVSAVSFSQGALAGTGTCGSPALTERVIAETDRTIGDLRLESALSRGPLVMRFVLCVLAVAMLTSIVLAAPTWARIGFSRQAYPLAEIEWPREITIVPLTGDLTAVVGESIVVRMAIQRGPDARGPVGPTFQSVERQAGKPVPHADGRSSKPPLRALVHFREADGGISVLTMRRENARGPVGPTFQSVERQAGKPVPHAGGETFQATIDAVTERLDYWFEAGDDSTKRAPFTIRVVRRPEVVDGEAAVTPPPYALRRPVRIHDLRDGSVRAPIGGQLTVTVRASKPIATDHVPGELMWDRLSSLSFDRLESRSHTPSGLRLATGELIPFMVDGDDPRTGSITFTVTEDVRFRIELHDADGFESRGADQYSILATPDGAPTVTVIEPKAVVDLTPKGSVHLAIRAEDDFGILGVDLHAKRMDGGAALTVPLTQHMRMLDHEEGVTAIVEHLWSVAPMSLSPGEAVAYTIRATDNRAGPGGGQVGRSATLRVNIISDVEFDIRLRDDLALLQTRLRQATLDQADLLDQTSTLLVGPTFQSVKGQAGKPVPPAQARTTPQRDIAAALAGRQMRLVPRLRELAQRLRGLKRRMERNNAGDDGSRGRVASLSTALEATATGPTASAANALSRTVELLDLKARQDALGDAADSEEEALERLRALIRTMARWGHFHSLLTRTRDLLDRQNSVRDQTGRLGKAVLGRPIESLTGEEAAALKRVRRRQEQLTTDVDELLARMRLLQNSSNEKDPSAAEAVEGALRLARAHDVEKHLRAAVKALKRNRTSAAMIGQKGAARALYRMVAALRERGGRRLEQLRRRLARVEQQVRTLIEQQQELLLATQEVVSVGADEAAFASFAQTQRTLKRNTQALAGDLAGSAAEVAASLEQAAETMGEAETRLRAKESQPAADSQADALVLLREALTRLEQRAREAADEMQRRTLAQIREHLEAMWTGQVEVNEGIGRLRSVLEERAPVGPTFQSVERQAKKPVPHPGSERPTWVRLDRSEAREASRLARTQSNLRQMVDTVLEDLQKVVVFKWALERVAAWMDSSRSRLSTRRIDDELTRTTDRIAGELLKLIRAIEQTESLPVPTEFVESRPGGGGGGGKGQVRLSKPVPTVAELIVLRTMQVDINERTRRLQEDFSMEDATEAQLREVTFLGEDQAEVRRLTDMVTRRAQHP